MLLMTPNIVVGAAAVAKRRRIAGQGCSVVLHASIMTVHLDREDPLGVFLTDHVLVQVFVNLTIWHATVTTMIHNLVNQQLRKVTLRGTGGPFNTSNVSASCLAPFCWSDVSNCMHMNSELQLSHLTNRFTPESKTYHRLLPSNHQWTLTLNAPHRSATMQAIGSSATAAILRPISTALRGTVLATPTSTIGAADRCAAAGLLAAATARGTHLNVATASTALVLVTIITTTTWVHGQKTCSGKWWLAQALYSKTSHTWWQQQRHLQRERQHASTATPNAEHPTSKQNKLLPHQMSFTF